MTKPMIWFNGHMHLGQPVQIDKETFGGTTYIRVESNSKGYIVVDIDIKNRSFDIVGMPEKKFEWGVW